MKILQKSRLKFTFRKTGVLILLWGKKWNSKGRHFFLLKSSTTCISPSPGFFHNCLCWNDIPVNILKGWSPGTLRLNCAASPAPNRGRAGAGARGQRGSSEHHSSAGADLPGAAFCSCSRSAGNS